MRASLAVLVVAIGVAATASAGARPSLGPRTFGTRGDVVQIAADGSRVAVLTKRGKTRCARVVVLDAGTKHFDRYDVKSQCPGSDQGAFPDRVDALALAGNHVAWLEAGGGNKLDLQLRGATLGKNAAYDIAFAENGRGAEESYSGEWIANVRGQGGVLVFSSFLICEVSSELDDCFEQDPTSGFDDWQIRSPTLVKAAGTQLKAIRKDVASLLPVAVDQGRIALAPVFSGRPVLILDDGGALKASVQVPAAPRVDLTTTAEHAPYALAGTTLYVLRPGALELYDTTSAKLVKQLNLPAALKGASLCGAGGGFVGLLHKGVAYALNTANGAARQASTKGPAVDAWLTRSGLFYAYNVKSTTATGRVEFIPLARL